MRLKTDASQDTIGLTLAENDIMAANKDPLSPAAVGVRQVPTKSLKANPHNPRMLFDKNPLRVLTESIGKVGILVPLTVYKTGQSANYVILDGQRRWIAAQELGLKTVPVNVVAEPSLVQNIVTMFQIHKLREDWELMPTALKVELLMKKLRERNDAKLATLTGLEVAVVTRCKKLLSYSREFQDLMLDPEPKQRVKADFFIELYAVRNDRFVNTLKWFDRDKFTYRMLDKYERNDGLKAVTDFRVIKQHISNAVKAGLGKAVSQRLREFTVQNGLTIEHLQIGGAGIAASARKTMRLAEGLLETVKDIDVQAFYGEAALWGTLEKLDVQIRKKLLEVGRRPR